jgi:hypothetical protein
MTKKEFEQVLRERDNRAYRFPLWAKVILIAPLVPIAILFFIILSVMT